MKISQFIGENIQIWLGLISGFILLAVFLHYENNGVRISRYSYWDEKIPESFKGFKIVQISDYHNTACLEEAIIKLTQGENPDIIAITGDLLDSRSTDMPVALNLAQRLCSIAPVYYVSGNHEARIINIQEFYNKLQNLGVIVLDEKKQMLMRDNQYITIMGVSDPRSYVKEVDDQVTKKAFRNHLLTVNVMDDTFKVLLSHRPEFIHTYRDGKINLALTGHAHGGQFGIPFTDMGVYVPNQGLFPPYAAGMKKLDDTTEIISRGLGNSIFPFRLFNRPEVVCVTFEEE
ncbi:MAG: metallophosphoesterase [Oscillospiraceae bacterium]